MLRSLQAGRAFAAIGVAAFHLSITMGAPRYGGVGPFQAVTQYGDRGVDFFFILSGFIILFAHAGDIGRPQRWLGYVYKRFIRLFPIYWIYSIPFIALLLMGAGTDAKLPTQAEDWVTALTLIRFTNAPAILPTSWTLFHEVYFYALFSLLLLSRRGGWLAIALMVLLCVLHYNYPTPQGRTPLNVYSAAYNLYFIFGMGAYWLYQRGGCGRVETVVGAVVSVLALWLLPFPHEVTAPLLALGFALLLAGITKLELAGGLVVPAALSYIGDASYTIYLIHESLQGLLLKIALKSPVYRLLGAHATFVLVMVVTIALGCLAYRLVEQPVIRYLRRRHERRSVAPQANVSPT